MRRGRIFTRNDAAEEKVASLRGQAARWAAEDKAIEQRAAIARQHAAVLATNPAIGMLMRGGAPVYYVMRDGQAIEAPDPTELVRKIVNG